MPRFVVFVTTLVLAFFVAGCSRELSPVSPVARGPDFQFDDGLLLTKLDGTEEPQGTDPAPIITIMNVTFPPGTESAPGREFEIELPANSLFRVPWTAVASPGSQIARTRWALGLLDAPPPTDAARSRATR